MKTVNVTKAGPYGKGEKEAVLIFIDKKIPKELESKQIDLLFDEEGKQLARLIWANVPGGLAVSLTDELAKLTEELSEPELHFVGTDNDFPWYGLGVPAKPPAKGCKNHKFVLGGVKYESNGYFITYYHWFFCQRCLQIEYRQFAQEIAFGNLVKFNATPK